MSYEKLGLMDGQVLKAEHLEHIENGILSVEEKLEQGGGGSVSDGVGISKVEQTTTSNQDGGTNIITVTMTDGTVSTFQVKNGSKGSDGKTPVKGTDYWTAEDIAEIKSYVDDAILGGAW